jgi:hypothetical protein
VKLLLLDDYSLVFGVVHFFLNEFGVVKYTISAIAAKAAEAKCASAFSNTEKLALYDPLLQIFAV